MVESNMVIMKSKRPDDYAAMGNGVCNGGCRIDQPSGPIKLPDNT